MRASGNAHVVLRAEDVELAAAVDAGAGPQLDERLEVVPQAPGEHVVVKEAGHARVRQDVRVSRHHLVRRERPVLLGAACMLTAAVRTCMKRDSRYSSEGGGGKRATSGQREPSGLRTYRDVHEHGSRQNAACGGIDTHSCMGFMHAVFSDGIASWVLTATAMLSVRHPCVEWALWMGERGCVAGR